MNETITSALNTGFCKSSPEQGIHYFVHKTDMDIDLIEICKGIEKPIIYHLNQRKREENWGNYYPFTLSIKSTESLYAFLKGDIYIRVVFDFSVMQSMAKDLGYSFDPVFKNGIAFALTKNTEGSGEPVTCHISEHFANRLGFEFLSLKWFMETEKHNIEEETYRG